MKLLLVIVLVLLTMCGSIQCFHEKNAFKVQSFQWNKVHKKSDSTSTSSFLSQKSKMGVTILEMKHRDPGSKKIFNWDKKLQGQLILDELHVRSLQTHFKSKISDSFKDNKDTRIPLISGIRLQILNYIVTIELGGRKMTVIVDTGSDLTWVQCQPCRQCYNQQDPIFNPSTSNTYRTVLCNSTTCQSLQYATGNSGVCGGNSSFPSCNYVVSYGDGSYTRGELATESISLGMTPVEKFVFGCGTNNIGLFGGASGLMGLGRSELSLISQTTSTFGGVFSYCLPTTGAEAAGSLVLGDNSAVYSNTTPIAYTSMVPNIQLPSFYFLNLTGIKIGGVNVDSPGFGKSAILLDSGTVITRLPPSIYRTVKAEFLKQFSEIPTAPGFSILDTCFNVTGYKEVDIPTLTMLFEGSTELNVDVTGIFYFVKSDASQVCLALASLAYEDEIGIIGNYQQRNQRVVYDTKKSKLGFAAETCSFN